MKVKELMALLKQADPEASVVSQEYTGCNHTIHDIKQVVILEKGQNLPNWDNSTNSSAVSSSGQAKRNLVYIN